jgi:formamidopyrimidine-DNA glycosylase
LLKEPDVIELPEAAVLARQINETLVGKKVKNVIAAQTPHKLAWYFGDPREYRSLLAGKVISGATSYGGQVEIAAGKAKVLFSDGVNLRYYKKGEKLPDKHQLLLEFDDGSSLVGWVQMYGGLSAFPDGKNDNKYYLTAKEKPSPLSGDFDEDYFKSLLDEATAKLSLKAFLATEQRIPGLGNGVLQDILFNAKTHPKKRTATLSAAEQTVLFGSIKNTLSEMTANGGRDTENDLLGKPGAYKTRLSKNTMAQPCPVCGTLIKKEAYLGGSIYYCSRCQKI